MEFGKFLRDLFVGAEIEERRYVRYQDGIVISGIQDVNKNTGKPIGGPTEVSASFFNEGGVVTQRVADSLGISYSEADTLLQSGERIYLLQEPSESK